MKRKRVGAGAKIAKALGAHPRTLRELFENCEPERNGNDHAYDSQARLDSLRGGLDNQYFTRNGALRKQLEGDR